MDPHAIIESFRTNPDRDLMKFIGLCIANLDNTKSQNFQDVWALYNEPYQPGLYLEFGATDGVAGSNTYMLEIKYGWQGFLVEPIPSYTEKLIWTRPHSRIWNKCIWTQSGEMLDFHVTDEPDLSTISGYGTKDEHAQKRQDHKIIKVSTLSLIDMVGLMEHNYGTPIIDYMSVDTEGSEYDILKAYFSNEKSKNHTIKTLSVEHNYNMEARQNIYDLLTSEGYTRKFIEISKWDDLYVKDL